MMFSLELEDAVLPTKVNRHVIKYIFSLLDCPEIEEQAMVRKLSALVFTNRIFANDQNSEARKNFLEKGIYMKLDCLLKESVYKTDRLSLLLTTESFSLIYYLLSIPKENQKIPPSFLEYFLTIISENKFDTAVQFAICCLCLLDWNNVNMKNDFIKASGFEILLDITKCSARDVIIDIIKIFGNFISTANHHIKNHLIDVGILKYIVGICNRYIENKLQFGGNADNLLTPCMIFLNNLMLKFYRAKVEFYKLGGMKIISEIYFHHPNEHFRKVYVEKLLGILLYFNDAKIEHQDFFFSKNRNGELSLKKRYPPGMKLCEGRLTSSQIQSYADWEDKPVDQPPQVKRSYQIGSVMSFKCGNTHAIIPQDELFPSRMDKVGKTICAMLNTQKNCKIYFGINCNSYKIEGKKMDRVARDKFRLACDTILSTLIKPAVESTKVQIEFVPVKDGEYEIPDLVIAEILLGSHEELYTFKNKTFFRYIRETTNTDAVVIQIMSICDEMKKYKEIINDFEIVTNFSTISSTDCKF